MAENMPFSAVLTPKTKTSSLFGRRCGRKVKTSCRPRLLITIHRVPEFHSVALLPLADEISS